MSRIAGKFSRQVRRLQNSYEKAKKRHAILDSPNMPSSVVAHIHYDENARTLRVVFVSGDVYDYRKVPLAVYHEMKAAKSKGIYLNRHIKPNYSFRKVTG